MPLKYDLHCHSTASDGSLSPEALLEQASLANIDVLALTDHDITDGLRAAEQAAAKFEIRLIPGVEISVSWGAHTIHVLGLNIDPENTPLQAGLQKIREYRDLRGQEIGLRLEKAGIKGALAGAQAFSSGKILSRTHFARFLVANNYAKDVRDVFKRYLVKNKPGHVPGKWAELAEAVGWITYSGGQAVIAHPARYHLSLTKLRELLSDFREAGGCGLEVVSSSHNTSECNTMAQLADDFELFATCGSDFHSPDQVWARLGRIPPLPSQCRPIWQLWA
jgi:hypothetical protein